MCGICGAVSTVPGAVGTVAVEVACDAIRHRGPDHGAVRDLGRCVLGYRRLRVVDLATGDQPVTNETGDVAAVFNGEIYSFRRPATRARSSSGHRAAAGRATRRRSRTSTSSTATRSSSSLDGMFALAVWDANRQRLLLARDRFGKKPLLWTQLPDGTVAFASELKALADVPGRLATASSSSGSTRTSRSAMCRETEPLSRGINRLPPGCTLSVENGAGHGRAATGSSRPRRSRRSDEEWLEAVRDGVRGAVRKRLVSDVPLGALLSGGIDSSIVVAAMAAGEQRAGANVLGRVPRARVRRAPLRAPVAERFGTEHEELLVEPDAAALLPRLAAGVRRAVRRHGGAADVPDLRARAPVRHGRARRATAATRSSVATSATGRTRSRHVSTGSRPGYRRRRRRRASPASFRTNASLARRRSARRASSTLPASIRQSATAG